MIFLTLSEILNLSFLVDYTKSSGVSWTGADYDPGADLLAVTGCIWACPYSTIVLDFSCPLQPQPPEHWLDLRHIVDPDDTRFDDIEFARWESDSMLLRGCDTEDGRWKEVRVSMEQLKAEML